MHHPMPSPACRAALAFIGFFLAAPAWAAAFNGGFETGLDGWKPLYTREPQTGRVGLEGEDVHSGHGAARVEYTGGKDWSFETNERTAVAAGDVYELQAWLKTV